MTNEQIKYAVVECLQLQREWWLEEPDKYDEWYEFGYLLAAVWLKGDAESAEEIREPTKTVLNELVKAHKVQWRKGYRDLIFKISC